MKTPEKKYEFGLHYVIYKVTLTTYKEIIREKVMIQEIS